MYFSRFGEMGLGESGLNRVRSSSGVWALAPGVEREPQTKSNLVHY